MPEVVSCPDCSRKLRVPDAVVGRKVQCPSCGAKFQATAAAGEGPFPEALPTTGTTSPRPVRKDPLSEFDEKDRPSRRRPPRAQPVGTNAAVTVLSILLTVLFLCAGGIKVIRLIEKWSKERPQKPQPVAANPAPQQPPPKQEGVVNPGGVVPDLPAEAPLPTELEKQPGIDLTRLFDPAQDVVHGHWHVADKALHCNDAGSVPRVQFPYLPPPEYNFVVTFAQARVGKGIALIMPSPRGGSFYWFLGSDDDGGDYGFCGKPNNHMGHIPGFIKAGEVHTTTVEVRHNGVRGLVDGKEVIQYPTDFRDLGGDQRHALRDARFPALACDDPTVFYYVRIIEVTGRGKKARE